MHADQKAAGTGDLLPMVLAVNAVVLPHGTSRKCLYVVGDRLPAAQVEIAHTKIGTLDASGRKDVMQAFLKLILVDVIVNSGHDYSPLNSLPRSYQIADSVAWTDVNIAL